MCGRTSCHCKLDIYQKACSYFDDALGMYVCPLYDQPSGHEFYPSTNITPTQITPVLISGEHLSEETTSRIIRPMMWGMIPPWHQGDYKSHGLSTNNCRIEGILNSKLYLGSLKKGNRCVIMCDGFYEWQTTKGKNKQPYFVYSPQTNGLSPEHLENWNEADWSNSKGWSGPSPLLMAGLFNQWQSMEGEIIFSYTVVTMESNEALSWLHHRMPAILTSDEQIRGWLDYESYQYNDALEFLKPVKHLLSHPVSNLVNNSRNKDLSCNKRVDLKKVSKSSMLMQAWLRKGNQNNKTTTECSSDSSSAKKIKKDEP